MSGPAPLRRMLAVRLVSADPGPLARFYAEGLGFDIAAGPVRIEDDEMARIGLGGRGERWRTTIAGFPIDLDRFEQAGRPCAATGDGHDLAFQHCAFVTADIGAAYDRAIAAGAGAISSGGPVTLPAASGGVTAVKLRDPEGHPFELIRFPPGSQPYWDAAVSRGGPVAGIDHSAIAVADAATSRRFYVEHGLRPGDATHNRGAEQAALDGLAGAEADVVPLYPDGRRPHLELLGYRPAWPSVTTATNDVAATRILWASDRDGLLRDPDGHRHQLCTIRKDDAISRRSSS